MIFNLNKYICKQDEWAALAKYDAELHKQEIFKKKEKERIN